MEKILNEYIDKAFEELVADTQGFVAIESVLDDASAGEGAPFGAGIFSLLLLGK